jgi:hypothetical protein
MENNIEMLAINKMRSGDKLTNTEVLVLKALAGIINDSFVNDICEVTEDCDYKEWSLKENCNRFYRQFTNHKGGISTSERAAVLEMIESACKMLQFY